MERLTERKGRKFEHHFERYKFASKYVEGKVVWSIACGTGYGEYYLATEGKAKVVHGADINEDAVNAASSTFVLPNLGFHRMVASEVPDNSADVFVSLETIEHIDDDDGFIRDIERILRPDGILVLSTPNRAFSFKNLLSRRPLNPFHVREYRKGELETLLTKHFSHIQFYGQKTIIKRSISSLWRYVLLTLTCGRKEIEKETFEVIPYPDDKRFETAYFVVICRK